MSRLLRAALESETSNAQTIAMQGPLGAAYTQALNQYLSKEAPPQGAEDTNSEPDEDVNIPALETQAMDAMLLARVAQAVQPVEQPASVLTVYGVSEKEVTAEDVVEVAKLVGADENESAGEVALIIDGDGPQGASGDASAEYVPLVSALESIASSYNVKVYRSLKDFVNDR